MNFTRFLETAMNAPDAIFTPAAGNAPDAARFADLLALCSFLPGPTSSELAMAIGLKKAGVGGALAAWAGFTLPSAALMTAFALGLSRFGVAPGAPWLHGLKLVAYEGGDYDAARFLTPQTVAQVVAQVIATPPDADVHEVVIRPR